MLLNIGIKRTLNAITVEWVVVIVIAIAGKALVWSGLLQLATSGWLAVDGCLVIPGSQLVTKILRLTASLYTL
jgi:hypothetical protein